MFGLLNIHKPLGWNSRDVVNRVTHRVSPSRVGHAGTLDPLAEGILVLCIGPATRLIRYVQQMPKSYHATFQLGCTSPSDDLETEVVELPSPRIPSRADIEATLPRFTGTIQQVPPAYSAINLSGKRAYELSRRGATVTVAPREVAVHHLSVASYEYPRLELDIQCGSGTYIRSLGRDIAQALGTGAVMTVLTRTAVGHFTLERAVSAEKLTSAELLRQHLLPPLEAVRGLPQIRLSDVAVEELRHGRKISKAAHAPVCGVVGQVGHERQSRCADSREEWVGVDERGQLVALLYEKEQGLLATCCNFAQIL